jgi:hypothetical protein
MINPLSETSLIDIQSMRVLEELGDLYTAEEAVIWMKAKQILLNGDTPMQRIRDGKAEDVLRLINQIKTGAYI